MIRRSTLVFPIAFLVALGCEGAGAASAVSRHRTAKPLPSKTSIEAAMSPSDDFDEHKAAFIDAAASLIRDGRCSLEDFRNNGGWVKSQKHKNQTVYFTYCGEEPHVNNRVYLDTTSGRVFR